LGGVPPDLSVVIPVCNEVDNVVWLAGEVAAALRGRVTFELIYVDDGSTDGTAEAAHRARTQVPEIRLLRHATRRGQTAAIHNGVRAARAAWIATLDGDGQNDPADIPRLLAARNLGIAADPALKLLAGHRTTRRDTWLRQMSSRVANGVRSRILGDGTPDSGCGLKLMERATFLALPCFDHMHRFLPALFRRQGASIVSVPVGHRPRERGRSKYGLHNRLWVGIVDLFGVMWLNARRDAGDGVTEE
jgi:dolichol-phosphate mannosyltransferase